MFRILLILSAMMAISIPVSAQLNDMSVIGIEECGVDPEAPLNELNNKPWALFRIEIEDVPSGKINGIPITIIPDNTNNVVNPNAGDTKNTAYAAAWGRRATHSLTLHHPDFNNCKVEVTDFIDSMPLKGGNVYKIRVKIPVEDMLIANRSYNLMDFATAKDIYIRVAGNETSTASDKLIASDRLESIDSVMSYKNKGDAYLHEADSKSGRERERALLRAKIYYNSIFKKTGIVEAGLKVDSIHELLGIHKSIFGIIPLTEFAINKAVISESDYRAFANDAVAFTFTNDKGKTEEGKCALIILTLPIQDVVIESDIIVDRQDRDGAIWLYVKSYYENDVWSKDKRYEDKRLNYSDRRLLTISHKDVQPFSVKLSDITGVTQIDHESVYDISIKMPSEILALANKHMVMLDFESARNFYKYNFEDAVDQKFAEKCLAFIESNDIVNVQDQLSRALKKYNPLDVEWSRIITGVKKYATIDERNADLVRINRELDACAVELSSIYRRIYNAGNLCDIDLSAAMTKQDEYNDIRNGLRSIPLILDFEEVEKLNDYKYKPPQALTSTPTVMVEFKDERNNKVDEIVATVKNGSLHFRPNPQASALFLKGEGTMKISTPKNLNESTKGKKIRRYQDVEQSINKLKISDYGIVRCNVTFISK